MKKRTTKRAAAKSSGTRALAKPRRSSMMRTGKPPLPSASDWQAVTIDRVRALIRQAAPDAVEEIKWRKPSNGMRGVPVWSHNGIICTGETYKTYVKLTFAKGAALDDAARIFNASLQGGTRRAIDIREGDKLDEKAFKALIRKAVALNTGA